MSRLKTYTLPEQVAEHLRKEIVSGRWLHEMPGRDVLAEELAVSSRSVQKALDLLEKEAVLVPQGQGRRSMVNMSAIRRSKSSLRVAILYYAKSDLSCEWLIELRYQLEKAGYAAIFPPHGLHKLGMDVNRVGKMVRSINADLWIVFAASREVLQWFLDNEIRTFAIAGRRSKLPIAGTGPDKSEIYKQVTQMFIEQGHQRIVFLCARQLRIPEPSKTARKFLEALREGGIAAGEFNLPDWEESPEGFQCLLQSLFNATPPTAMILDEPFLFHAAYHFLAKRNIKVPEDVSLICTDPDPNFAWCRPTIAHIDWDYRPVVRRIIKWVNNVARGVDDRRQSYTKAKYVPGGTVSPRNNTDSRNQ